VDAAVLRLFPSDMPVAKLALLDPNAICVEDEALRGKAVVAIHAARAATCVAFEVGRQA
jgi:hypothetical protein